MTPSTSEYCFPKLILTLDPLAVRFTDLHRYVTELPDFAGDPKASNEGKLEAIQMAWHEEVEDRTQG